MRPCIIALLPLFFCTVARGSEPQFDTGFIEWSQPNSVTFIAKAWGNEYTVWYETDDGYRFVTGPDGWHYYATLDQYGEFALSQYRVAIDSPPSYAYQLERTQERMNQIDQFLAGTNPRLDSLFQYYSRLQAQRNSQGRPLVIRVNVLLAEFQDVRHYRDTTNPNLYYGYKRASFDSMLFSHNWWIGNQGNIRHPEGDSIFGSLRDFYEQMSLGKFLIDGHIVNPSDTNGIPVWISFPQPQSFYGGPPSAQNYDRLLDSAFARAVSYGWLTPADTANDTLKYIVVYAGNVVPTLIWTGSGWWSGHIKMSERKGPVITTHDPTFTHIGWPAHEFGHLFGFQDEYMPPSSTFDYDLMAAAAHSGPKRKGACPGSLSPYYRIGMHWVSSIPISHDTTGIVLTYSYQSPRFYRIDPVGATGDEHYIIETRLREGFDQFLPNPPNNFATQPGVLLIWHHNGIDGEGNPDKTCLMFADNVAGNTTYPTDFFPKDPRVNRQSFNDLSVPPAILGFYYPSSPPQLRRAHAAHFALNGIRRSGNNTIIDTIALRHSMVSTPVSSGWHMLGVPANVPNFSVSAVYPTATSPALAWLPDSEYVVRTMLELGKGYFIRFGAAQDIILAGGLVDSLSIAVNAQWNLLGSISDRIPTSNVCVYPYPSNRITSLVFNYVSGRGYVPVDSIKPGLAHWVKVQQAGTLVMKRFPSSCRPVRTIELAELDHFEITDANGGKQDVYVANVDRDPSLDEIDLSMPPPFPQAEFDARFGTGEYVKTVSAENGIVELILTVETQAYPVTITWELNPENGIEYSIITEGMGKQQSTNRLAQSGSAVMTTAAGGKFRINAQATGQVTTGNLPTEYSLAQNYPNPFNPETRIHYELPHDNPVRLVVYDLLGREVATLVNEFKKAGRYEVAFSATNLASGVYFYRLQAGRFHEVKKLILIR